MYEFFNFSVKFYKISYHKLFKCWKLKKKKIIYIGKLNQLNIAGDKASYFFIQAVARQIEDKKKKYRQEGGGGT